MSCKNTGRVRFLKIWSFAHLWKSQAKFLAKGHIMGDFEGLQKGIFYQKLTGVRPDSDDLKQRIEETVSNLLEKETNADCPGMLLGQIQSGKTGAFIRVIALAFDNQYDIAIVLTKGTKALAKQTYERLKHDFWEFIRNDDVQTCDIMHLPDNLTRYERQKKLIIVVKKQTHNMTRIIKALVDTYPDLGQKRILIIDDEADNASVGYKVDPEDGVVQMNKIAKQISELREKVAKCNFLQVTATPYSLYLQPEEIRAESPEIVFKPIRPAFTILLPVYPEYIGGDYYFEESDNDNSVAFFIYEEVPREELETLRRQDRRSFRLEEALTSPRIRVLRSAVMNFIVGACIRRVQQENNGQKSRKYSFIVHTESSRASHAWQEDIVEQIKTLLAHCLTLNQSLLDSLLSQAFNDIKRSIEAMKLELPEFSKVKEKAYEIIRDDHIMIARVNSERQIEELLDESGQLRLRTPLNIFIGGQILDRGLTIDNLIGFYYGRRPNRYQQDTVLQHSRMYGRRPKDDLAVTRFYTARIIYDAMGRIHELDTALRRAFQQEAQNNGVIFLQTDSSNQIIPCSPNKILISTTTTLRPSKRMLPVGFQTGYKSYIKKTIDKIDTLIDALIPKDNPEGPFLIDLNVAQEILKDIFSTYEIDESIFIGDGLKAMRASMEFLSKNTENHEHECKIWCLVRKKRSISRFRDEGRRLENSPDTQKREGVIAKETAIDIPMLMLFRQAGEEENEWRGYPFWWPVLMTPQQTPTVVFANDTV